MIRFLLRRLVFTIPVVFGVMSLSFFLIHFVPGDPIDIMLGEQASNLERSALKAELGLDKPLLEQYGSFFIKALQGDLGRSLQSKRPVLDEIIERIPATVELTLGAMFLAILFGVPLGILAASKKDSWIDNLASSFSLVGMSVPGFWLGPILILVFSIQLDLLPVSERGGLEHLILPACSLALALGAIIMRMTRASMIEVIREDYIRTARSKGLNEYKVFYKHALRNALMPVITILGLQFGALLTGTVITETIFDWPGIGTLLFSAIQQRNYPLVQATVLVIALTYVLVNTLVDVAYAIVNPKVRLS